MSEYTLQAYIEHPYRPHDGGFTLPLPTTSDAIRSLLRGLGITDINCVKIANIRSLGTTDPTVGRWLNDAVLEMADVQSLEELNYLAAKIRGMNAEAQDLFAAALQAKWQTETVSQIINLSSNLHGFDLQCAAINAEVYGIHMLDFMQDDSAEHFERLKNSDNPREQRFAEYIRHLEKSVDPEAYGELLVKEEGGVFTDGGYLTRYRKLETTYHGIQDIPEKYQLMSETKSSATEVTCLNGTLQIGDLVLSAPFLAPRVIDSYSTHENEEVYSSMVGTVTELIMVSDPDEPTPSFKACVDFTTPAYSERRLIELDRQIGDYYGRDTTPGIWPPTNVDCADMSAGSLLRITDMEKNSALMTAILDREVAAKTFYETAKALIEGKEEKAPVKVKPSLIQTLKDNARRSRERYGDQSPQTQTKDKGEPSL